MKKKYRLVNFCWHTCEFGPFVGWILSVITCKSLITNTIIHYLSTIRRFVTPGVRQSFVSLRVVCGVGLRGVPRVIVRGVGHLASGVRRLAAHFCRVWCCAISTWTKYGWRLHYIFKMILLLMSSIFGAFYIWLFQWKLKHIANLQMQNDQRNYFSDI